MSDKELLQQSSKLVCYLCDCVRQTRSETIMTLLAEVGGELALEQNRYMIRVLGNMVDGMDAGGILGPSEWVDDVYAAMKARFPTDDLTRPRIVL